MTPRFYYHETSNEPQHTFIVLPAPSNGPAFGGWGPTL